MIDMICYDMIEKSLTKKLKYIVTGFHFNRESDSYLKIFFLLRSVALFTSAKRLNFTSNPVTQLNAPGFVSIREDVILTTLM